MFKNRKDLESANSARFTVSSVQQEMEGRYVSEFGSNAPPLGNGQAEVGSGDQVNFFLSSDCDSSMNQMTNEIPPHADHYRNILSGIPNNGGLRKRPTLAELHDYVNNTFHYLFIISVIIK